jgi:hypothetical protein
MIGMEDEREIADNYRRFARLEAHNRSPLYEELAEGMADDAEVLELLLALPRRLRQPNLLLAVVRLLFGTAADYPAFRSRVVENWAQISAEMRVRRTQTNEPARCATLLPLLASLPQPLALLEVGASAGLCLLPDRYRYDYRSGAPILGAADSPVLLRCLVTSPSGTQAEAPSELPEVVWRMGVDIAPIDVRDASATRWLEALLWPGEGDRLERLQAALEVARSDPPPLVQRDLATGIGDLVAAAPGGATVVVFHTAVFAYLAADARAAFAAEVGSLPVVWLSQEGPSVFSDIAAQIGADELAHNEGRFALSHDGAPVAWTDPHGAFLRWRSLP